MNNADLDKKVATLATKAELKLKAEQDEIIKLQAFDSSYFHGKSHFENDETEKYLVFQPMYRYFKKIGDTDHISTRKFKGLSDESIKPPATSNNSLAPSLNIFSIRARVKVDGSCLKQAKIIFVHEIVVNIYIVYKINL